MPGRDNAPRHGTLRELASLIKSLPTAPGCLVIAISGFGGAGKSTVARQLQNILKEAAVICIDDFILDQLRGNLHCWEGIDWARLQTEVLQPIEGGAGSIIYGVYDWTRNSVVEMREVRLHRYLIIEGVGLLRSDLMKYFDYSIWLDVPLEEATKRGIRRDREQYHVDYERDWRDCWSLNDREYFEQYKPMELADFILRDSQRI